MSNLALSNLSFFEYGSRQVRTAMIDGEIVFGLADALKAMKSTTTTAQAQSLISEGLGDGYNIVVPIADSLGREQDTIFVFEAALTFLISRSRTAIGRGLNKLIHTEILPSIRRTGKYEVAPAVTPLPPAPLAIPTTFREAMMLAIDLDDSRTALKVQIESDAPLVAFANAVQSADENILIGVLAKSLGDIGPSNLMALLRYKKILITSTNRTKHNTPFQLYIDRGYFVVDEGTIEVKDKTRLTFTTKVTPKGQIWLTSKYYEWQSVAA
jgi:phage antirepressor YoqD-like protein